MYICWYTCINRFKYFSLFSYLIRINGELYGLKSKFHIHGLFLFLGTSLIFSIFELSTLDERLTIDGLRLILEEKESRDKLVDDLSAFPDEELPPGNKLSND